MNIFSFIVKKESDGSFDDVFVKDVGNELPPLGGHGGHGGPCGHGGLGGGAGGGQLHSCVLSLLTLTELAEARGLQALHSVHLRLGLARAQIRPLKLFID